MAANLKPMTFEEWIAANPDVGAETAPEDLTCATCCGDGVVECGTCFGEGEHECGRCDAMHECGHCEGTGTVPCEDCDAHVRKNPRLLYEAQLADDQRRLERYRQAIGDWA